MLIRHIKQVHHDEFSRTSLLEEIARYKEEDLLEDGESIEVVSEEGMTTEIKIISDAPWLILLDLTVHDNSDLYEMINGEWKSPED